MHTVPSIKPFPGDPSTWRWSKRDTPESFSWEAMYDPARRPQLEEATWLRIRGVPVQIVGALIHGATVNDDTASPYHYSRFPVGLVESETTTLIWNNRTSAALTMANVPRTDWAIADLREHLKTAPPGEAD
jgi:hypothetical protein